MLSTIKRTERSLALPSLCVLAASIAGAQIAYAQDTTETALSGQECAADRAGGSLNCTANEYVVTATSQSNTITACHNGDPIVIDIVVGITSSQADRYNIGYWVGEANNPPDQTGGTCSIATFPTTPTGVNTSGGKWFDAGGGNTCGDYNKASTSSNLIQGVHVTCARDSNGNLVFPFTVTYAQNSNDACTGPSDVVAGSPSKCVAATVPVTNVTVQFNANPTCGKSVTYDPVAGTVTSVITVTNNGPDEAPGVHFDDIVPGPVTVTGATCTNTTGGAACPASITVNAPTANEVSGTIDTFPSGSTVEITIVGTVPGGQQGVFSNTANLSVDPNVIITPIDWVFSCTGETTLPVRLQNFDVK
jgi:uncharacterized repeat protein (TIGR01451 family)